MYKSLQWDYTVGSLRGSEWGKVNSLRHSAEWSWMYEQVNSKMFSEIFYKGEIMCSVHISVFTRNKSFPVCHTGQGMGSSGVGRERDPWLLGDP